MLSSSQPRRVIILSSGHPFYGKDESLPYRIKINHSFVIFIYLWNISLNLNISVFIYQYKLVLFLTCLELYFWPVWDCTFDKSGVFQNDTVWITSHKFFTSSSRRSHKLRITRARALQSFVRACSHSLRCFALANKGRLARRLASQFSLFAHLTVSLHRPPDALRQFDPPKSLFGLFGDPVTFCILHSEFCIKRQGSPCLLFIKHTRAKFILFKSLSLC